MLQARELKIFEPSIEEIRAQKNSGCAFGLACDCSRLDAKKIYMELGFDAAQFSRIKSARASLPADLVSKFCQIVGNTIYLEWLAYQVGCTLVMIKSEAERKLEISEKKVKDVEEENAILKGLLKDLAKPPAKLVAATN